MQSKEEVEEISRSSSLAPAITPVKVNDALSLTWSDFAKAIKVEDAERAYDNAVAAAASRKAEYDKAKAGYAQAEENLQSWEASLSPLLPEYNDVKRKVYQLPQRISILERVKTFADLGLEYIDNNEATFVFPLAWYDLRFTIADFKDIISNSPEGFLFWGNYGDSDIYLHEPLPYTIEDDALSFQGEVMGPRLFHPNVYFPAEYYFVFYHPFITTVTGKADWSYKNPTRATNKEVALAGLDDCYNGILKVVSNFRLYANTAEGKQQIQDEAADLYSELDSKKAELEKANESLAALEPKVLPLQKKIDEYTKVQTGETESEQTRLANLVTTTKAAYDEAKALANAKLAVLNELNAPLKGESAEAVQTVSLTSDMIADVVLDNYSGVIDGDGYCVTLSGTQHLINNSSAHLANMAVNGNVSKLKGKDAHYQNVAYWDATTKKGGYYDEDGNKTSFSDLGALGFAARDMFGVDFKSGRLTSLKSAPDTKVFDITVYTDASNKKSSYVHVEGGKLTSAAGAVSVPANTFVYSKTDDLEGIPNVFYKDGERYYSDDVVISKKDAFYCPVDMNAKNVTFSHTFSSASNMSTICLPFTMKEEYADQIEALCTFNRETANNMIFTKSSGEVAPNTPMIIFAHGDFELNLEGEISLKQTPDDRIVKYTFDPESASASYGTFRKCNPDELKKYDKNHDAQIWGFDPASGTFKKAISNQTSIDGGVGESASLAPFMMLISAPVRESDNSAKARKRVKVQDEFGNDITSSLDGDVSTGIDEVEEAIDGVQVIGGQGEIIITSGCTAGNVAVYSIDGRLVAAPEIHEGQNVIGLAKGVYVVAGQKVLVK